MIAAKSQSRLLVSALPVIGAVLASMFDRDFWFAAPLAVLLTLAVGAISFMVNRNGAWAVHALVGGTIGWVASVAILMNLEI
ncbi:hypothetical protein [Sphingomonas sp. M1A8_2b]